MIINIRKKKFNFDNSELNISFENNENDKIDNIPKVMEDMKFINGMETNKTNGSRNKLINGVFSDSKSKKVFQKYQNKSTYPVKLNNNINKFEEENDGINTSTLTNRNNPSSTESNYVKHINNSQLLMRNYSMNNYINTRFHNNIDNSIITNNNNTLLIDNNKSTHADRLDPKNAIRINRIKDEYIDFLQKQYEDNNKINLNLDSNNKELLQKCNDLIQDNLLLNKTISERTTKLNKSIQENTNMKAQLDKSIMNSKKNEQKMIYYEEQLKLFKSNNDNYQKIIQDLKEQNYQLNLNLKQIRNTNEEEQKKLEEKYKIKLEEIKKNIEESYNEKIQNLSKNENEIKDLLEQIKILKEKNNELIEELKKKEEIIEIMYKDNEKLVTQNNLNLIQIEQNTKQINDLNQIIQHKENLINSLKTKEIESEKIVLNKSNSRSSIKLENSDFLSENITKLLNDNEENKLKIEYLNDKIKTIREIEKKYNELMGEKKSSQTSGKTSYMIRNVGTNSPKGKIITGHTIYISKNSSQNSSRNNSKNNISKKFEIQDIKLNYPKHNKVDNNKMDIRLNYKMKPIKVNTSLPLKTINVENDNSVNQNDSSERIITEYKDNSDKKNYQSRNNKNDVSSYFNKNRSINLNKNNRIIEIDVRKSYKEKKEKSSDKITKGKMQNVIFKGRNFFKKEEKKNKEICAQISDNEEDFEKQKKANHGKELEEEKDEVKENIRQLYRKKNFTHKPNASNISLEEIKKEQENEMNKKLNEEIEYKEEEKINNNKNEINYYLYGIDRNDLLHVFNINKKKWMEKKKIFELDLDDKAESFRKDYQYEGTLLYNMLEGVYILTGEKTDTLYYFSSKTNSISKICKFNNCHDNGSIMYDESTDCLYVFGGKKIRSCEYYSFFNRKVYKLPDLISDRANASFIISNNKIFGFFGFSYENDSYVKTIEYMDYNKKDKWVILKNIKMLKDNIYFDVESVSTMYYKQNINKILIYSGIQGEDEEFIIDYYLLYDVKNNTMDKINKWNFHQFKHLGVFWKEYNFKKNDPKGFHFAKNSRFILLPEDCQCEGYNKNDIIDILIDYKNNIHFIMQNKEKIDIYRGEI